MKFHDITAKVHSEVGERWDCMAARKHFGNGYTRFSRGGMRHNQRVVQDRPCVGKNLTGNLASRVEKDSAITGHIEV